MDFIVYILLSIVIIGFISFGFWHWYCSIRQTIAITKKIEELNVKKMTFADLLASKKLIGDDNDKN